MDLRQLRALVGVAENGSFSAAADALHTVQSNVSAHIARLEAELGVTLVDRHSGRLTEEGEIVAHRARRIQDELDSVGIDLAALSGRVSGTARIGMIGTTARWLLPQLLQMGAERHPQLRLEVMEGTSTALDAPLLSGRLDLAVGTLTGVQNEIDFEPLFEEDLVAVVSKDDELARHEEISLVELARRPMLLPLPGTAFRSEVDAAAEAAGVRMKVRAEIDGTRLLASLTFDGHGPAILPATAVAQYMRDSWRLVRIPELPRRTVGLARRSRTLLSVPARAVVEMLYVLTRPGATLPRGLHPTGGHGTPRTSTPPGKAGRAR